MISAWTCFLRYWTSQFEWDPRTWRILTADGRDRNTNYIKIMLIFTHLFFSGFKVLGQMKEAEEDFRSSIYLKKLLQFPKCVSMEQKINFSIPTTICNFCFSRISVMKIISTKPDKIEKWLPRLPANVKLQCKSSLVDAL